MTAALWFGSPVDVKSLLFLFFAATLLGSEPEKKPILIQPIPELKLTSGTVFKNVIVVRYEKERVVLKSSAGVAPLAYSYIPEPTRALMIAERDVALAAGQKAEREARVTATERADAERVLAEKKAADQKARREKIEAAIREKSLVVGMTPAEATHSWGAPARKNTSGGKNGSSEQWVYATPMATYYVYFDDGALSSWQTSERK